MRSISINPMGEQFARKLLISISELINIQSSSSSSSSFIHTYSITKQKNNKKKKDIRSKTELIYGIHHNKGKKCVAPKAPKLASWLPPQSGYKQVKVVQYALNSPPAIFQVPCFLAWRSISNIRKRTIQCIIALIYVSTCFNAQKTKAAY